MDWEWDKPYPSVDNEFILNPEPIKLIDTVRTERAIMAKKGKKQLMSSAPWRGEDESEQFPDANLKVTRQQDDTSTMHVPRSKSSNHNHDDDSIEIDPELRYSFQRNFQVLFCSIYSNNSLLFLTCLLCYCVKETQIRFWYDICFNVETWNPNFVLLFFVCEKIMEMK